jgi:uncharacterized protein YggU (UPF0235/DUF167 family)
MTRPASGAIRIAVHVSPGAKRPGVGARYGDELVVRVREPAVDQLATTAALRALAAAFGVAERDVRLIRGARSRRKLVEIGIDPAEGARIVDQLLHEP